MFTDSIETLVDTALTALLAYGALILVLRVSGKRTLAKLSVFDFVVTIALGSILATIILSGDTSLLQGIVAFVTLVGLQYIIAWLSVRVPFVLRATRSLPVALVVHGQVQTGAMVSARVTQDEIAQAVRRGGCGSIAAVAAVVLETDGTLSVIRGGDDLSALDDVGGWPTR